MQNHRAPFGTSLRGGIWSNPLGVQLPSFATFSTVNKGTNVSLSNGNLTASFSGEGVALSNIGKSSGKWYCECSCTSASAEESIGIALAGVGLNATLGNDASGFAWDGPTGKTRNNGSLVVYGNTFTSGQTLSIALDMDNGKVFFGKTGTWQNSGNPATGVNPAFSGLSGTFFIACSKNIGTWTFNFGATGFSFSVPSGFNSGLYN